MDDFVARVVASAFFAGAAMYWLGYVLLPAKIGTFFQPTDFERVYRRFTLWIWLFRVHLFGHLVTMMALVALGSTLEDARARVVAWPGIAVASSGLIVAALAAAFYYHFGAWGSLDMAGKPAAAVQAFTDSLKLKTEYVTCLVRFGRVFFGLGQVVLALGLLAGGVLPTWLNGLGLLLGVAAMALTMAFPDNLEYYQPVFHLNVVWLLLMGVRYLG